MNRTLLYATSIVIGLSAGGNHAGADILIATAGPMAGNAAAFGEEMRRGTQQAIDDINATGGLRGERLALTVGDDGCDPKKAVEVATGFVSQGVKLVAGHFCSGSSIPASKIYEAAGIVQISPASTNPRFTSEGGWNVLRVCNRDDAQGAFAAKLIAAQYRGKRIALLNDKSPAGTAMTERARQALATAGIAIAIDDSYTPGSKDYSDMAQRLRDGAVDVIYIGGTYVEAGLIIKQLRAIGSAAQLIGGDGLVTDEFWNIAGDSGEGTLMTFTPNPQKLDSAKAVVQRFADDGYNPEGYTLHAYAAVQAWVQAAEATGGIESHKIAGWLRGGNKVKTVLGEISFDGKGDVTDPRFTWYRWSEGKYTVDANLQ